MYKIDIEQCLDRMALAIQKLTEDMQLSDLPMIGIHTGGVWIAEKLHQRLKLNTPIGQLNIAFYRDDFSRIGIHPRVVPSQLPFLVQDKHILLVDDVLHTGRTIRAALNEIFDYGRPASIILIVLITRNGHELPIQADVIGKRITLQEKQHIKLIGPKPLELILADSPPK